MGLAIANIHTQLMRAWWPPAPWRAWSLATWTSASSLIGVASFKLAPKMDSFRTSLTTASPYPQGRVRSAGLAAGEHPMDTYPLP